MSLGHVTIGDAWVALHADKDQLREEIRRAVNEAGAGQKFAIPATVDSRGLRDEITRAIASASAGQKFVIPATVDSRGFREEIDRAVKGGGFSQKITIPVTADSKGFREEIRRAVAEGGFGQRITVPLDVDRTKWNAALGSIRSSLTAVGADARKTWADAMGGLDELGGRAHRAFGAIGDDARKAWGDAKYSARAAWFDLQPTLDGAKNMAHRAFGAIGDDAQKAWGDAKYSARAAWFDLQPTLDGAKNMAHRAFGAIGIDAANMGERFKAFSEKAATSVKSVGQQIRAHLDFDKDGSIRKRLDQFGAKMDKISKIKFPGVSPFGIIASGAVAAIPALVHLISSLSLASSSLAALAPAAITGAGAFLLIKNAIKSPTPELKALEDQWSKVMKGFNNKGLQDGLTNFLSRVRDQIPVLNRGMEGLSNALGSVAKRAADAMSTTRFGNQLSVIFAEGTKSVTAMGGALNGAIRIFMSISATAAPLMTRFSQWLSEATQKLAALTEKGEQSGKLGAFFKRAGDEMAAWGKVISNVASGLFGLFHAANAGTGSLAQHLEVVTARFKAWTQSVQGQQEIKKFFDMIRSVNWAALAKGVLAFLALQKAIGAAGAAAKGFSSIMSLMKAGPMGLVAGAVIALAAGFALLYTRNKTFHDWVNAHILPLLKQLAALFKDHVLPVIKEVAQFLGGSFMSAWRGVMDVFNRYKPQLELFAKVVGVVLFGAFKLLAWILKGELWVAIQAFTWGLKIIMTTIGVTINGVKQIINAFKEFANMISWTVDHGTHAFAAFFTNLHNWFFDAYHWVNDVWHSILKTIQDVINTIVQWGSNTIDHWARWIHDRFFEMWHDIDGVWHAIYNTVISIIRAVVDWAQSTIDRWGRWIHDRFFEFWHNINDIWHTIHDAVVGWVQHFIDWVKQHVDEWVNWFKTKAGWLHDQIAHFFQMIHDKVIGFINDAITWVKQHVEEWFNWFKDKAGWLHEQIAHFFQMIHDKVIGFINDAITWVKQHVDEWSKWIHDTVENIHTHWSQIWQKIANAPKQAIGMAVKWVADRINNMIDVLNDGIKAVNKFTSFVGINIPTVDHISAPAAAAAAEEAVPGLAMGGQPSGAIQGPGTSRSDSVLARVSTDEYVINANSVKALGLHNVDFMNKYGMMPPLMRREGGSVPWAPRFREGGSVPWAPRFAAGGRVPAMNYGGVPTTSTEDEIIRVAQKSGIPFGVSSAFRGGSHSAEGNLDYHSQGLAVDFTSPNMPGLAAYFMSFASALLEEIHSSGGGFFVKNGKRVGASFYGAEVPLHYDHVHIAMTMAAAAQVLAGQVPKGPGTPSADLAASGGVAAAVAAAEAQVKQTQAQVAAALDKMYGNMPKGQTYDTAWHDTAVKTKQPILDKVKEAIEAQANASGGGGGPNSGGLGSAEVEKQAYQTAKSMGADNRAILALFEAGFVESNFQNIQKAVDHDSLGFLQQRPSAGWPDPLNVPTATRSFISRAMAREHAGQLGSGGSAGQLAQSVQVSAFPGRYDQEQGRATAALKALGAQGFYSGGTVTGPPGIDNVLIKATPGEKVLNRDESRAYDAGHSGACTVINGNLTVTVPLKDLQDAKDLKDLIDRVVPAGRRGVVRAV